MEGRVTPAGAGLGTGGGEAAELAEAARRIRAQARRVADVRQDLDRATRGRVWAGPAAQRFERSVERRRRELETQAETLDFLADRLQLAARALTVPTPGRAW
jgi:uncharacterized protein YukE